MRGRIAPLLCCLLVGCSSALHGQQEPELKGYVTRAASGSDFDVNGYRVLCSRKTRGAIESIHGTKVPVVGCPSEAPFLGEGLIVDGLQGLITYGPKDEATKTIDATDIEFQRFWPREVSGSAVIDAVPAQQAAGAQAPLLTIRADGYRIRVTRKTKIEWSAPLHSLADVKTGDWIKYKAKEDAAGVLTASSIEVGPNAIGSTEEKLRANNEYDPSAVSAQSRQNYLKDVVTLGYDPKKFPPFNDPAMQARIEKIGNSLVPAYQRALPDSDSAKINFRFQLIDTKLIHDAATLPNGIILVPHQVIERMQNDSQLAAVLADAVARALERQQYRIGEKVKMAYASTMAAPFVPYAGLGMWAGEDVATEIQTREMEQDGRVSLALMHDAGYDIDQAPVAWWVLASGKPDSLSNIDIPDRAVYLYRVLGEVWNNPAASALQAH